MWKFREDDFQSLFSLINTCNFQNCITPSRRASQFCWLEQITPLPKHNLDQWDKHQAVIMLLQKKMSGVAGHCSDEDPGLPRKATLHIWESRSEDFETKAIVRVL